MNCPFKKKTIHHERAPYTCAYDVEAFAECDYSNCPFYNSKEGCRRVNAEISALEILIKNKYED